jgi:hypothetical protein
MMTNLEQFISRINYLKSKGLEILIDGKINPRFIPRVNKDEDSFQLMLLFDLKNE